MVYEIKRSTKTAFMKQQIACTLFAAMALVTAPSAFAQNEKEKDKEKKEIQHIIITRTGDIEEKTVIEIKGDKVTVNGKDASDNKDVNVKVNKIKDGHAYAIGQGRLGATAWNLDFDRDHFSFDGNKISLFSEDSNRAMLGVITDTRDKGAEVIEVSENSAAAKAGLKKGDVITRIGDKKVEDAEDVSAAVKSYKPGDKVNITILRDGKEQKLQAELTKWKGVRMNTFNSPRFMEELRVRPTVPGTPGRTYVFDNRPRLGLSVQDTEDGKGVKIISVEDDSNAAKAGLKEDDVITHIDNKEVNSTDEVTRIVKDSKDKTSFMVKLLRDGKPQNIEVRIPRKVKTADL